MYAFGLTRFCTIANCIYWFDTERIRLFNIWYSNPTTRSFSYSEIVRDILWTAMQAKQKKNKYLANRAKAYVEMIKLKQFVVHTDSETWIAIAIFKMNCVYGWLRLLQMKYGTTVKTIECIIIMLGINSNNIWNHFWTLSLTMVMVLVMVVCCRRYRRPRITIT